MKTAFRLVSFVVTLLAGLSAEAQVTPAPVPLDTLEILANREVRFSWIGAANTFYQVDAAEDVSLWSPMAITPSLASSVTQHTDAGAPYRDARFYRKQLLEGTNWISGDVLTTDAGPVLIHPVNHASFIMQWNGKTIYADPVGGAARYAAFPRADLILVTHSHSDHFDAATLNAVKTNTTAIAAPQAVYTAMSATLKGITTPMTNGQSADFGGIRVEAIPAYNLTSSFHAKGTGNGYVLTIGNRRIYISGDTEDIPEMRALTNIDVAFVCMNLPYTMTVARAVSAVRAFQPKVVYLYHWQGMTTTDVNNFKSQVAQDLGIEVRIRKWY